MSSVFAGKRGGLIAASALLIGIVLPFIPGVYVVLAVDVLCFALFAVSLDLLLGFGGMLSFGHALFWGGAAYAALITYNASGQNIALAILAGLAYSAVLALISGIISIQRHGIYFAMITLALAQLQYFFAFQLVAVTGGENGISFTNRSSLLGIPLDQDIVYYFFVLAIVALSVAFTLRVVTSPFGAVLAAMRDNEQRAKSLGYDVQRFKLMTFVMSGVIAGLAGTLFALANRLAGLDGVDWHTSGKVVMMTILGGIGTIFGPMAGAAIFEMLDYFVSKTPLADKTNIVMGLIFAVVILAARRGVVGEILHATLMRPKKLLVEDETKPGAPLVPEPSEPQLEPDRADDPLKK